MYEDIAVEYPNDAMFQYVYSVNPGSLNKNYWTNHFELEFVKTQLTHSDVLFDFGCGSGCMTSLLFEAGYKAFGYDLSEALIQVARRNSSGCAFYSEFPKRVDYTKVWMCHTLEHIPLSEYGPIFKKFKPNTPIVISVPHGFAYDDGSGQHLHHWNTTDEFKDALSPHVRVEWVELFNQYSVLRALAWTKRRSSRSLELSTNDDT